MNATRPHPGTVLPNGATVIITLPHPTDASVCYVGAQLPWERDGLGHPFATWCMSLHNRSTYWGHYSSSVGDMLDDLQRRAEGK